MVYTVLHLELSGLLGSGRGTTQLLGKVIHRGQGHWAEVDVPVAIGLDCKVCPRLLRWDDQMLRLRLLPTRAVEGRLASSESAPTPSGEYAWLVG